MSQQQKSIPHPFRPHELSSALRVRAHRRAGTALPNPVRWRVHWCLLGLLGSLLLGCGARTPRPQGLTAVKLPELSQLDPNAKQTIEEAYQRVRSFRLERTEDNYHRLALDYGNLGMYLLAYQIYEPAAVCFQNAQTVDDQNFTWPYCLGHVHRQSEDAQQAIASFERALELLEKDKQGDRFIESARCWIGDLSLQLNEPKKAKTHFEAVLQDNPQSAFARFGLAQVAEQQGDQQAAIDGYRRALQYAPDARNLHYALMIAFRKAGDQANAEVHKNAFQTASRDLQIRDILLDKVDKLDTTSRAHRKRGYEALFIKRDYMAAARHYQAALKTESEDAVLHHNLATALARLRQTKGAIHHYQEAIRLKPDMASAHANLGVIHRSDDLSKSIEHLRAARKYDSEDPINTYELALSLLLNEDFAEAEQLFSEVLAAQPAHAEALMHRASSFKFRRDYAKARDLLTDALTIVPDHGPIRQQLVEILATCPDETIRNGKQAIEVASKIDAGQNASLRAESLAMAYAEIGDFQASEKWLTEAITIARQRGDDRRLEFLSKILKDSVQQQKPVRLLEYVRRKKK